MAVDPNLPNERTGYICMVLLALQYGLQPLFQKRMIDREKINTTSLVMVTECTKIILCIFMMYLDGPRVYRKSLREWTLMSSLKAAAVPAVLYAVQNVLTQLAYGHLDSLTFNLLNQTKTLSAAMCLYLVMGKRQSGRQMLALLLLAASIMLLNAQGMSSGAAGAKAVDWELGVAPVLTASFLSGLSAAITQRALQTKGRYSYLLSLELAVYGLVALLLSLTRSQSGQELWERGMFHGWTSFTWVPVLTQAVGGLIVGQVTKHAGSVKKGFALIAGILVTAVAQSSMEHVPLSRQHYGAAVCVAIGTYMHSKYPYQARKRRSIPLKQQPGQVQSSPSTPNGKKHINKDKIT